MAPFQESFAHIYSSVKLKEFMSRTDSKKSDSKIPGFRKIMLPLLGFLGDGKEHSNSEAYQFVAHYFHLSEESQNYRLDSGNEVVYTNRTRWARGELIRLGFVTLTQRAHFQITNNGKRFLKKNPTEAELSKLARQVDTRPKLELRDLAEETKPEESVEPIETPSEIIERQFQKITKNLTEELLEATKNSSPSFFEKLVVDLIVKMGYGGSRKEAGKAIGKTRDGGIDGVINEDRLGLDVIYIQAKRWNGPVGSKEIQQFVGALRSKKAAKGIFVTTSQFSKPALDYLRDVQDKVILINGEQLARYMIESDLGVSITGSYAVKKIDNDYFSEE
jgi:restriction system protein